jgi:Amt family ammonium transporter
MACKMGFTDFAGSSVVHSVGGWASVAALVGPRIGKYNTDGTVNAIPGHNLMLGALGVFILWFDGLALIQGHN